MTDEEFKQYLESIADTREFQEIYDFLKISKQKGETVFEKMYNYLRIQHSRTDVKQYGIPDYTHFCKFFEAYKKKENIIYHNEEGYIDLSKTLHMRQPVLYATGKGEFTDSYCLFTDGSIYISKLPLHYAPNKSGIFDSSCKYSPIIATEIAKTLGIETSENVLGRKPNKHEVILSKYFLEQNEELINFYEDPEEPDEFVVQDKKEEKQNPYEKISNVFMELEKNLKLRHYPKDQIEKVKFDFLKQEFLAKLIDLKDQKADNTGIITSIVGGKRSVRIAPMFDYDFSFKAAEDSSLRSRKADNGKADITSLIEQYKDYPGFLEFVKKSVNSLDMENIYESIYIKHGLKFFQNYKENSVLKNKFTSIVNTNLDMARATLHALENERKGEEK